MDGICTLANDRVYDQLVALLNSIEAILGPEMPVCVYPYNDNTEKISLEIAKRPNVQLYDNKDSMQRWDQFFRSVWDAHPTAHQRWKEIGSNGYHRFGTHRRFCAFDGPFDRFLYMDADTLLQGPVAPIFNRLNDYDWVVYDFQYTDLTHVYDVSSPKLLELFTPEQIKSKIFCSGFYAAKKGLFNQDKIDWLLTKLREGEAEVLYTMSADQPILNYMVIRGDINSCNLALQLPENEITGCCADSSHFEARDHILYDRGNRLTYIHYIGFGSDLFNQICAGNNIDFPNRELFFHYRYLHEPEKRPHFKTKPKAYDAPPSLAKRILRKLGLAS
ncbi:MAG: sugar transferase [Stigonema ocellatum SAG 48.90 = DSM 106950]|nr:sugar transferase [Stigonema ocellatum SAG 48.90 = DSM 106950]